MIVNQESIESFIKLLQLSISPIVLISGSALFLLSLTNRLARTIDRSRSFGELAGREDHPRAKRQLPILIRRSEILRTSITCVTLAMIFGGLMIVGLFFLLFLKFSTQYVILFLFFLSILSLIIGMVTFLMDIFLTLKALKISIND